MEDSTYIMILVLAASMIGNIAFWKLLKSYKKSSEYWIDKYMECSEDFRKLINLNKTN